MALNKCISVPAFINPHLFWIFEIENREDRVHLQKSLTENLKEPIEITAVQGELVVVLQDKIWRRAEITNVFEENYDCWLIDYGFLFKTMHIYQLPYEFTVNPPMVKLACLNNVVELREVCQIETGSVIRQKVLNFSCGLSKLVNIHILQADTLFFHTERIINHVLCGQLQLVNNGASYNLVDVLVKDKQIAIDQQLFREAIKVNNQEILQSHNYVICEAEKNDNPFGLEQSLGIGRGRNRNAKSKMSGMRSRRDDGIKVKCNLISGDSFDTTVSEINVEGNVKTIPNLKNNDHCVIKKFNIDLNQRMPHQKNPIIHVKVNHQLSDFDEGAMKIENDVLQSNVNLKDINDKIQEASIIKGKVELTDEGTRHSPTCSDTSSKSTLLSKLPGSKLVPAGASLTSNIKFQTASSKHKSKGCAMVKTSESDSKHCSDSYVRRNKLCSIMDVDSSALSDSRDSELIASGPCNNFFSTIGCKCENCQLWNKNDISAEYNNYKDSETVMRRTIMKPSPLFKNKDSEEVVDIKSKKFRNATTQMERDKASALLVHGFCIPAPVRTVCDVPFSTNVLHALTKLKFSTTKSIQSYAWPALMRQMNVCIVNGPSTGKTMTYLPAICSFILEKSERYADLPMANGPIAIILCGRVSKVEETFTLFCRFQAKVNKHINVCWAVPPLDNNSLKIFKTCDILITTPITLIRMLKYRIITFKRLCHFVVEETDIIFNKYPDEFNDLMCVMQGMLKHRSCIYTVQIVTCSEHWTVPLEGFLRKLFSTPLICIGPYLECALYGRANIQMHFVQSINKFSTLCDILKEKTHIYRTVVICNELKVDDLEKQLRIKGVSVVAVNSSMKREEILDAELIWKNTVPGTLSVLICTDALLDSRLSITDARLLIHYSLPTNSWTQFSKRFKCIIDSIESMFSFKNSDRCQIHVFVDEKCNKQFPRLCNFLHLMGANVSQNFLHSYKKIKNTEELQKLKSKTKLCASLKLFGECNKVVCKERHTLSEEDVANTLPQKSIVKFKLKTINDVSIYTVQLIEHTEPDGTVHKYPNNSDIDLEVARYVEKNRIYAGNPKLGELYAFFDVENNLYHRCEIVKIISEDEITKLAATVHVKLIDLGCTKKTTITHLFELSEFYRDLPAQGIEVYLSNILPPDKDDEWSFKMKQMLKKILDKAEHQKSAAYFSGRVVLQLGSTLWLDDVRLQEVLDSSNETVTKLTLKEILLENYLVTCRNEPLTQLYNVCKAAGIKLYNNDCVSAAKVRTVQIKQAKPHWAHLDEDSMNAVYFCNGISPHQFYVCIEKFYTLFQKLQQELQTIINRPHYPKVTEVVLGNCYLVKDPASKDYCRAIVTDIQNDMVKCFFVDFGDDTVTLKSELQYLPDAYIKKLPFQAIECKLFGICSTTETWSAEATDVLYQYCFEPKTDIYRTLYVSTLTAMKSLLTNCQRYTILLVDYYNRQPVVINRILIDCGLAIPADDVNLDNIALLNCRDDNGEPEDDASDFDDKDEKFRFSEVELIKADHSKTQNSNEQERFETSSSSLSEGESVWDIEMNDAEVFMKELVGYNNKSSGTNVLQTSTTDGFLHPIKSLPPAKYRTPDVFWYQTDKYIKIDIDMHVTDYVLQILRKRIFTFSTISKDNEYKLNFQLYDAVEKTVQSSQEAFVIRVTLKKCTAVEWPRLTASKQKLRYIKYDVSKCNIPEEKKRIFLEIDKNEKEHDEGTDMYIEIGSDENYSESDIESELSDDL